MSIIHQGRVWWLARRVERTESISSELLRKVVTTREEKEGGEDVLLGARGHRCVGLLYNDPRPPRSTGAAKVCPRESEKSQQLRWLNELKFRITELPARRSTAYIALLLLQLILSFFYSLSSLFLLPLFATLSCTIPTLCNSHSMAHSWRRDDVMSFLPPDTTTWMSSRVIILLYYTQANTNGRPESAIGQLLE